MPEMFEALSGRVGFNPRMCFDGGVNLLTFVCTQGSKLAGQGFETVEVR
jgi:hypothetical protein